MATDTFHEHLSRFLAPLSGTDKGLRVVFYAAKVAIWALEKAQQKAIADKVRVFGRSISEARTLHRFFGSVDTILGLRTNNEPNKLLKIIYDIQNISLLFYYPCEHVYYFATKGIISLKRGDKDYTDLLSRMSCIGWAVYIFLDFFLDGRSLRATNSKLSEIAAKGLGASAEAAALRIVRSNLLWKFAKNFGDFCNAIHWSMPSYPLPEVWVGLFGVLSSVAGIRLNWRGTAKK
eukprot:TRINITY_DN15194_c0_g1_i1.p2 TRINITY_DN15194_c0_g1~~TRINITY_DN15194_c0_g1_i1.p2  ORF type:complete len:234 (-),score=29.44 TRINITY_DN15194_c0_g1_i1:70-771(-)